MCGWLKSRSIAIVSIDSGDMPLWQPQIDASNKTVIEIQTGTQKKQEARQLKGLNATRWQQPFTKPPAAPEGTPDREADARSKIPSTAMVPRTLVPERVDSGARTEMGAATISALRSTMRHEIKYGMVEMEHRFAAKLTTDIGEIREELGAERADHQQFQERLGNLEQRNMGEHTKHAPQNFEDEKWTSRSLWWVALF